MFKLAAWLHCCVYISKGLVTRGYIHFVFIIFVLESMLLQVVQVVLLLVVLLLVGFGDAVMYDDTLIWFKYEDDFGCCWLKGSAGSGIFWFDSGGSLGLFRFSNVCRLVVAIFTGCISNLCSKTVH